MAECPSCGAPCKKPRDVKVAVMLPKRKATNTTTLTKLAPTIREEQTQAIAKAAKKRKR